MERRMLTTGEIGKFCGVNFRTALRWIARGQLKAHKLPGRGDHRIVVEDFIAFLKEHKMPIPIELGTIKDRVLIVDDDLAMAKSIERILKKAGFTTMIADNGFRAGALLGTFRPAVITLDLQMPGLGGMDVLRFVRGSEHLAATRILVVSAMPQEQLGEAMKAGANDVLAKPFRNDVLVKKVRGHPVLAC